ncbi:amino acid ABC transporter permease [Dietzia sp. UBA5065]|jgi:glutamate transport system permease protein|uniref:amino acid ABC transporter permease n=1 Tax=Dietzia sp. UBA5065 TaxID=1946422 RepID=UPI0025C1C545|nr:amino acid ABC transporter permease [Dietzia sp. UBA5065]HMT50219.1 amino acid ABC transporter permease [Dietzia sp.]
MSTQAVLFDAPGPKARLRHKIFTVVGALLALGILYLIYAKFEAAGQLKAFMWEPFVTDSEVWTSYLIPGLRGTFTAAGISIVLAVVFGLLFGMGRLSPLAPLRWFCGVVVEFFRSVPVLLMMVFAYFGYFATANIVPNEHAPLAAVVTALTLYNGAVIAELVRSGVHGLPSGQAEAGLSVGLTPGQVLRSIQLPQALTAMLPALVGQLVVVLKDSALGYGITYLELLNWSKTLGSAYANTVPAYIVAGILFILVNYALTKLAVYLEGRLKKRRAKN